jgi:hypothetical protein
MLYRLGYFYIWGLVLLGGLAGWSVAFLMGVR